MNPNALDFREVFKHIPGMYLLLEPVINEYRLIEATEEQLKATATTRDTMGKKLFEVFPDNPSDPNADGSKRLKNSLDTVINKKVPDTIERLKYDIPIPGAKNGEFEERFWTVVNYPVLDDKGELLYIINHSEDVTDKVRLEKDVTGAKQQVKESESELALKVVELEKINSIMIGRELKMQELKEEIEELKAKLAKKE